MLKFFWEACLLSPRALSFDFCYDLDFCSQGQAVRVFPFGMGFSLMLSKEQGGFWSNVSESFIDRWQLSMLTFALATGTVLKILHKQLATDIVPKMEFLAHLWGAYAIPVALSGVRRLS